MKGDTMSARTQVVERYLDGFRRTDHGQILSCLDEGVVWRIHGYKTIRGKTAFDIEIEGQEHVGHPVIVLDRLVEGDDAVAACGHGSLPGADGGARTFSFCEVFGFSEGLVERLDTYRVWNDPR
jgi:hypothetical protein